MSRVVEAAGGVVWRRRPDGEVEVALVHRPRYGDWTLPIGRVEPGESLQRCALREVREETGCECVLGPFLGTLEVDDAADDRRHRFHVFAMTPTGGTFAPNPETDRLEWLTIAEAVARATYPNVQQLLAEFGERSRRWKDGPP